jgi:sirohydrochlorin cobaltochelatase
MSTRHLILLAHGSTDPDWRAPFEAFCQQLAPMPVTLAYMEMASPTLAAVMDGLLAQASPPAEIDILPLFMAAGGHLKHDVPRQVEAVQQAHPQVTCRLLPPVGQHPAVVRAMAAICHDWANPNVC